jgi:hypothetical protein
MMGVMFRRVPAVFLLVALIACAAIAAADGAEPLDLPPGQVYVHEPSGFHFPPDVGTFTRVSGFRYDDEGQDVSVGYNDLALKVIVTAYVYPARGESLLKHFEHVKHDVRQIHPEVVALNEGPWTLEQGERKFTGRRAAFAFRVTVGGKPTDVVSEAYLVRVGSNFIKFRATCPKARYEAAEDRVGRFLQSLKFPEPAAAATTPAPAAASTK